MSHPEGETTAGEYTRSGILRLTIVFEGAALAAALVLARYLDIQLFPVTDNFFRDIAAGTAGAVPPLVLFLILLTGSASKIRFTRRLREIMLRDIRGIFSRLGFLDIVIISLVAGIAEEALFRGVLQVRFGIIAASILFGIMHFVSPAYALVAVLMGFYIGFFYSLYGSLLVPVQLHFLYDLGAISFLRYGLVAQHSESNSRPV